MKTLRNISAILFIAVLFVLIILWYVGYFGFRGVMEKPVGPYIMVYEEVNEAKENDQMVQNRVFSKLRSDGFHPLKHFGIYSLTNKEKNFISKVGCIIEGDDTLRLANFEKKYNVVTFNKQFAVEAEFNYQNKFSMFVGMLRVYPALRKYTTIKGFEKLPVIEIYDISGKTITYIMPIKTKRFNTDSLIEQ